MKKLSVALLLFFISLRAFSESKIISEFELNLPKQFQQKLLNKKWESLANKEFAGNWKIPDQTLVNEGVPVNLKDLTLQVKTSLLKPSLDSSQTSLQLVAKDLQAILRLGDVSIDHVVERSVGGILGRFRVQGKCTNVILQSVPGQLAFSMQLKPSLNVQRVEVDVQDVQLAWGPGSWTLQNLNCQGVDGFEDVLKNELIRISSDSKQFINPYLNFIRLQIQESLQVLALDLTQQKILTTSRPDITILMEIKNFQDLGEDGLRGSGQLTFQFAKVGGNIEKYLSLGPAPLIQDPQVHLRLPKDFLKEFAIMAYVADSWNQRVKSSSLAGFNSLMNSRFMQFFVWPELMNYSKTAPFIFDVSSHKNVQIFGETLKLQVHSSLDAAMWAPQKNTYVPFMNFSLPVQTAVEVGLNKGTATLHFKDLRLDLKAQWDTNYLRVHRPSQRFAASTVRDRIVQSLSGKSLSFKLPTWPVGEGTSLRIESLQQTEGKDFELMLVPE